MTQEVAAQLALFLKEHGKQISGKDGERWFDLLTAYASGQTIEYAPDGRNFEGCVSCDFLYEVKNYRIRRTELALTLPPMCWIRPKGRGGDAILVTRIMPDNSLQVGSGWIGSYPTLCASYEFSGDHKNWQPFV